MRSSSFHPGEALSTHELLSPCQWPGQGWLWDQMCLISMQNNSFCLPRSGGNQGCSTSLFNVVLTAD